MVNQWQCLEMHLLKSICITLVFHLFTYGCWSISLEGLALLEFREKVEIDPHGIFNTWKYDDKNPCTWSGVYCEEGHVHTLDLRELSLLGWLAPELGKLTHLRALILYGNHFIGGIPNEIARLPMMQILDLRSNNQNGTIPAEIGDMPSLKLLLLCNNNFEGVVPEDVMKHIEHSEEQCDHLMLESTTNRKIGYRCKNMKGCLHSCGEDCSGELAELYALQGLQDFPQLARRKLLAGSPCNFAALPAPSFTDGKIDTVWFAGSGSFPASRNAEDRNTKKAQPDTFSSGSLSSNKSPHSPHSTAANYAQTVAKASGGWNILYVVPAGAFLLIVVGAVLCVCRRKAMATIGPWKTGLSGQLQKAFVTGVPKLNRAELESACEDFSNIISTLPECKIFKGTLSSGVEIAVACSSVRAAKDWSIQSEHYFRKKIDIFSHVNHKNFVNLLGYCEEDEPFLRVMVFEYAPSGTLFEHLHGKETEHLDWSVRMRIIMGIAYCLQYLHHELYPPVVHPDLQSDCVLLTDDYAAKVTEVRFWKELVVRDRAVGEDATDFTKLLQADCENNVYSFGILMLEIISGKPPYSEEQGLLVNWAADYLNDKQSITYMIDPSLKSFKNNELDVICEVILECLHQDMKQRPTMKDVTAKLRNVLGISMDAAAPRLSPLWWAELEILSVEAS